MDKTNNKAAVDMANKNRTEFADDLNVEAEKKTKSAGTSGEKK